jgi:hypothetical protein
MNRAYKARIAESKGRLEESLLSDAKRFGHHGVADFIEIVRQRHNVAITEDYAYELLTRAA